MPLYEYRCSQCSEKFEKLVSIAKADDEIVCPKCGSKQTRRLVSAFGWVGGGGGSSSSGSGSCAPSFGGG